MHSRNIFVQILKIEKLKKKRLSNEHAYKKTSKCPPLYIK